LSRFGLLESQGFAEPTFPPLGTFTVATLVLASRPRQRGCKVAGKKEPGSQGKEAAKVRAKKKPKTKKSPGITSHTPESVRSAKEYEGMNPHTLKATPTLGDEVPVDSRNFRERLQGSKLNGLWHSLYHWKALETYMSKMGSHCSLDI